VRERLSRQCQHIELPPGQIIYAAGAPVEHMYFIESGLVALVKTLEDGQTVEIGAKGTEGLVGLVAFYGSHHAFADYIVQVPVVAERVKRTFLQHEISHNQILRGLVERYLFLVVDQIAQTAACNRLHSLEQRLCRWMLTAHDNTFSNHFSFTHEVLATLLGVQRPSLSAVANQLQKSGLIHYVHGRMTILDRAAIEERSCECYRAMRTRIGSAYLSAN
jgi:CRP-like cAMP-binding protein